MALDDSLDDTISLKLSIEPTELTARAMTELEDITDKIESTLSSSRSAATNIVESVPELSAVMRAAQQQAEAAERSLQAAQDAVTAANDVSRSRAKAIQDSASYMELQARNMAATPEAVSMVSSYGGIQQAIPDQTSRENGSWTDQIALSATHMAQQALGSLSSRAQDLFSDSGAEQRMPRVMEQLSAYMDTLPEGMRERLTGSGLSVVDRGYTAHGDNPAEAPVSAARAPVSAARAGEVLAGADREESQIEAVLKRIATATSRTAEETAKAARSGSSVDSSLKGQSDVLRQISAKASSALPVAERLASSGSFGGMARELASMGSEWAVDQGSDGPVSASWRGLDRTGAQDVASMGGSAAKTLMRTGTALKAAKSAGTLVSAGSTGAEAATGLGAAGGMLGGAAGAVGSVASAAAVPLAVAALAYGGLDKANEQWNELQQSGNEYGGRGWSAVGQGIQNKASDFWRGLNPLSSASSSDFAQYRSQIANSRLGINVDSDGYDTLTAGMATGKDLGLDSKAVLSIFGEAVREDPDFDLDDALGSLADAAKESTLGLQDFTKAVQAQNKTLEATLGVDDKTAVGISTDMTETMSKKGGILSDDGIFGSADTGQQVLTQALTPQSTMNTNMLLQAQREGLIDSIADPDSATRALVEQLDSASLEKLISDASTQDLGKTTNATVQRSMMSGRTGVNMTGEAVANAGKSTKNPSTDINITVSAGDGLAARVDASNRASSVASGEADYDSMSTTNRWGVTHSTTPGTFSITSDSGQ